MLDHPGGDLYPPTSLGLALALPKKSFSVLPLLV